MGKPHQPLSGTRHVSPCPPGQRREALLCLAAAHDPALQSALSGAVKAMMNAPDQAWEGLWVSDTAGQLTGAIWVQPLPMNMAQLWLPNATGAHARALLRAAHAWVEKQPIRLCHLELSPQAAETETLLLEHGMQRLVSLVHLIGSTHCRLAMKEARPLTLQPLGAFSQAEQINLLAAVGHDSLDSVPLRDVLSVNELLAGFHQQDPQAPLHWYVVYYQDALVGVLLLAPRPLLNRWELMLMGLIPEWRGIGLGRALLNSAMAVAQQAGVKEVILAVDEVNLPAKRLYQQAGFRQYAQQRLLAWKGGGERSEGLINA
ncbi:GNAT family N-acetyltransferase [Vreelandella sp. V005]|uniref:GNAT family N-acetyltransferase n=1 Tax=Vreelandella sp. V005 TaxID=3459608 RepID=UPI0040441A37